MLLLLADLSYFCLAIENSEKNLIVKLAIEIMQLIRGKIIISFFDYYL